MTLLVYLHNNYIIIDMKFNTKYLFNPIKICVIISALLFSNVLLAQDDEFENYSFDDNESPKLPYFALSFGGNAHFLFMKYDDINKKPGIMEYEEDLKFSGPIICFGFDFFSAMSPLVNNARIGITYSAGSQVKEYNLYDFPIIDSSKIDINLNRKLSVSNIGIHFDYAFVPIKSLAILPGLGLKFGTMTLEQYATVLPVSWDSISYVVADQQRFNEKLEYSYFAIEPQISIEYAITGFFMIKVAGAYVLPFDNPFYKNVWTINGNNAYSGVPNSVKPQGFSVSAGVYLGLFNY
jgi:hypothetical protein